jgi:hypothetical protein
LTRPIRIEHEGAVVRLIRHFDQDGNMIGVSLHPDKGTALDLMQIKYGLMLQSVATMITLLLPHYHPKIIANRCLIPAGGLTAAIGHALVKGLPLKAQDAPEETECQS